MLRLLIIMCLAIAAVRARRDRLTRLDLMLTARDWNIYGFAPL